MKLMVLTAALCALALPVLAQDSLNCRQRGHWAPPYSSGSQAVTVDTTRTLVFIHVWVWPEDPMDYDNKVYTLDVANPDQPLPVGPSLQFPDEVFTMHYEAGMLYVVSAAPVGDVLWVYDVTDVAHPELLGHCDIPDAEEAYGLAVSGDLVFAVVPGTPGGDVRIISVSDPRNPVEIAAWSLPGYAFDIAIAGNLAFITGFLDSLFWVVDVTAPQSPVVLGSTRLTEEALGVAVAGNHAYLSGDKLFVVDISNPQSPVEVASHPVRFESYYLAVRDNLVYLPAGGAGLRVFDVSNPEDPTEVGYYTRASRTCFWDVAVMGNLAFVADDGLRTIEFLGAGVEDQRGAPVARPALGLRPNPARNRVRLVGTESAVLYGPDGRKVAVLRPGENCVARLPRGVYFFRLATGRPNRLVLVR
ncbi:MAG: hypothetical protein R6X14_09820 [bacterium]